MTLQAIPTFTDPFPTVQTTLENVNYLLSFSYNTRSDTWWLSVADAGGVDIYNGLKLVCNVPLLRRCADSRRPPGELFVVDSTGQNTPPGLDDLGPSGRCTLVYITSDWLKLVTSGQSSVIAAQLASNTQTGTGSTYGQL